MVEALVCIGRLGHHCFSLESLNQYEHLPDLNGVTFLKPTSSSVWPWTPLRLPFHPRPLLLLLLVLLVHRLLQALHHLQVVHGLLLLSLALVIVVLETVPAAKVLTTLKTHLCIHQECFELILFALKFKVVWDWFEMCGQGDMVLRRCYRSAHGCIENSIALPIPWDTSPPHCVAAPQCQGHLCQL